MSGTILLIEPDIATRNRLSHFLRAAFFRVVELDHQDLTQHPICPGSYDLVLLGAGDMTSEGLTLCRMLKSDPDTALVPVIAVVPAWADGGVAAFASGAEDVLIRDTDRTALLARVRSLIRMKLVHDELDFRDRIAEDMGASIACRFENTPGRVLIAAGSKIMAGRWAEALSAHQTCTAHCMQELLSFNGADVPDVIVLHQEFSGDGGLAGIVEIRSRLETRHTPVLFVPRPGEAAPMTMALDLGANDYVVPPVHNDELAERVGSLLRRKRLSDRLRRGLRDQLKSALTDPLTGLHNRRYALAHLDRQLSAARAQKTPISLLMLDLDRFKSINDRFGHAVGDAVLREVGTRLASAVRNIDLVARLGGEEFLVVMPGASEADAGRVAERIRRDVRRAGSCLPKNAGQTITLSAGLAVAVPEDHFEAEELIARADQALYASKQSGRDRVSIHQAA